MIRGRRDLGVVETIYEEEHEDFSNCPSPLTTPASMTNAFSFLKTTIDKWSKATMMVTDMVVCVGGGCFHLHKKPLTSRSRYLKQHLAESKDKTVYLPSCITAEIFALVACFCYSQDIVITPFNVVALRIAAELLDMTEEDVDMEINLGQITEAYFCQAVAVNATTVLRSCLYLLPEAEETAFMVSRCIEALVLMDGADGSYNGLIDGIRAMTVEEFQMVLESMKGRFARNHDLLYKILHLYIKEHNSKLTEEEKNRICCCVDCNKLSHHLLMHAVQNANLPLRFVIRAMLVEQLNTRHSIAYASAGHTNKPLRVNTHSCVTLGTILQRDAAMRCTAQLKATMEATSARIISLENELMQMKRQLQKSEMKKEVAESARSVSCRFSWEAKGERGEKAAAVEKLAVVTPRSGKGLSRTLIDRLRNVFRTSKMDSMTGNLEGPTE